MTFNCEDYKKIEMSLAIFGATFNLAIKQELTYYAHKNTCKCKKPSLGHYIFTKFTKPEYEKYSKAFLRCKNDLYFEKLSKSTAFNKAVTIIEKQRIKRTSIPRSAKPLIDLQLLLAGILAEPLIKYFTFEPEKLAITKEKNKSVNTRAKQLRVEIKRFTALEMLLLDTFLNQLDFLTHLENLEKWDELKNSFYGLRKGRKDTGTQELFLRFFCKSFKKYFKCKKEYPPISLLTQVMLLITDKVYPSTIYGYLNPHKKRHKKKRNR